MRQSTHTHELLYIRRPTQEGGGYLGVSAESSKGGQELRQLRGVKRNAVGVAATLHAVHDARPKSSTEPENGDALRTRWILDDGDLETPTTGREDIEGKRRTPNSGVCASGAGRVYPKTSPNSGVCASGAGPTSVP